MGVWGWGGVGGRGWRQGGGGGRCHPPVWGHPRPTTRLPGLAQVTVNLATGLTASLDPDSSEGCILNGLTLQCTWADVSSRTVKLLDVSANAAGAYACTLAASWTLNNTPGQAALTETLDVQSLTATKSVSQPAVGPNSAVTFTSERPLLAASSCGARPACSGSWAGLRQPG